MKFSDFIMQAFCNEGSPSSTRIAFFLLLFYIMTVAFFLPTEVIITLCSLESAILVKMGVDVCTKPHKKTKDNKDE